MKRKDQHFGREDLPGVVIFITSLFLLLFVNAISPLHIQSLLPLLPDKPNKSSLPKYSLDAFTSISVAICTASLMPSVSLRVVLFLCSPLGRSSFSFNSSSSALPYQRRKEVSSVSLQTRRKESRSLSTSS